MLRDKMPCTVALWVVNCFLRVPQVSLGSKAQGSMAGTPVQLSENSLLNLQNKAFCQLMTFGKSR